jgi:hypothetical protein
MFKLLKYFSEEQREVRRIKKWLGNDKIKVIEVSRKVYDCLMKETPKADPSDITCHNIHYAPQGSIKVIVNEQMIGSKARIIKDYNSFINGDLI